MNNLDDLAILNGENEPPNDGNVAPLDGSQSTQGSQSALGALSALGAHAARAPLGIDGKQAAASAQEALAKLALGPNNERLEELRPDLVNALRELVVQYREEGIVARRHEIRRIRQARLFWQGLQYAWWNPQDMTWHLPYESKIFDDSAAAEMPRYQFVTNLYQAFGLSFISVLSQDVPATRFYPQSAQSIGDITAARAASEVCDLVEQNNRVQHLLTGVAFYLWTDGKIGGYVRYVADAQRFGSHDEPVIEEHYVPLGEDAYVCPECGAEQEVAHASACGGDAAADKNAAGNENRASAESLDDGAQIATGVASRNGAPSYDGYLNGAGSERPQAEACATGLLPPVICRNCGASLGPEHFKPAPRVAVPLITGVRRVANGQEVISVVGGLELNTPVWANEMHEYPYLQWSMEVHRAKLKASYPHAADKIQMGGPIQSDEVYARATRVAIAQGLPTTHPGDALFNLITFSRTWIRPWSFYAIEDKSVRDALLALFPDGCYVAFAGETYCESRNESMDDRWRVMHALPGDGQNRPSVGDSLVQIQERYNTLSNIQAETYEYGIPPIYADPQVLDFDALANQTAEPAAHYPARARPGQPLAAGFFQPAPAQVPPDLVRHQQELMGPVVAISHRAISRRVRRRNGIGENRVGLRDGARPGARAVGTGVAAAQDILCRRDAAVGGLLPQKSSRGRGDSDSRAGRGIRVALDSPGRSERQHSGASGKRRNISAPEIAAARRRAAIDGVVRSAHPAGARRSREYRIREGRARACRTWSCRERIRATSSCARLICCWLARRLRRR